MSEEHSNDHIEDVVLCSQNCDEINSPKNEKDEKDCKNFSSESSDSYYKNKFRLKKNSIEIKKKSLLKSKLKNDDIQTIIKNDPILSKLNKTMTTDEEIFDLANKKENKTKFKLEKEKKEKKEKKLTNDSTNNKNKNNSVLFLNENQENKNQLNHNNEIIYELNEQIYDINNISEDILKNENNHINIEYNEKVQDQDNTLNINETVNKIQLNSTRKQKQKEKTKKEIKLNEQNEIKKNNQNFNSSILNEIKKNKELSPLSLIKKHGRLINNIEEIYNSNCEQIQNVRDEFAELKNDLNKIMNLINIGQKAVASLK
ncbi:conserved Plasmodium protein, unknown function [Plasmodium reichenowi]|uniref:Uncharacterized protein n=1 Tax=Plasmodium reichenowi TaxID=5854 RepID=A0A060S0F9_PLARE|nr:conserved Plasmodium protein, unknown function [Plasmodium reichenowi]